MTTPLEIVIIGGSLSGLMCGVALKQTGHNVCIFERDFDERQSHMAGVSLGRDVEDFLTTHDRIGSRLPFYIESSGAQIVWPKGAKRHLPSRRLMSSWDALYYRLRANFDRYVSDYCPVKPDTCRTDGSAVYRARHRVLDIHRQLSKESESLIVKTENQNTHEIETTSADFVIAADGPNSFIRARYLPSCERQYAGNIAWRGTVPENKISTATRDFFKEMATITLLKRQHCLVYMIPGKNGSIEPGERLLNFLRYTNETQTELQNIMIDSVDGIRHHHTVPAGHVQERIWKNRLAAAETIPLTPPFLEVIRKIQRPFIQAITEFCAPQAVFEDGKVLLIGDAVSVMRPHTGFSGSQAAFHTSQVVKYIQGKISMHQYDRTVTRFSALHSAQSIWWGKFYQNRLLVAVGALLNYWRLCLLDRMTAWWNGERPLLRSYDQGEDKIKNQ